MITPKLSALFLAAALAPAAFGATVFFTDFESGVPAAISGAGFLAGTEAYPTAVPAFLTKYHRNDSAGDPASPTILSLGGLAAHTTLTLTLLFAPIDSWDGEPDYTCCSPDYFNIDLDGSSIFMEAFNTYAGTELTGGYLNLAVAGWVDHAYALTISVPHTASTAVIKFFASGAGWQAGDDESFAIDNVKVETDGTAGAVPEPSTWVMLGSALAGLAAWRKRSV